MFDPFTLALIGGAAGGLLDSKNPLRGMAIGATGGYFAPAALGAAGAGGASTTAGLLGVPGAATGAGSQAAMLAAQNAGFGATGMNMLGQAAGTASGVAVPGYIKAGAALENGFWKIKPFMDNAKPFIDAAGTAQQVAGMFGSNAQPMPAPAAPPLPPPMPTDLNALVKMNMDEMATTAAMADERRKSRRNIWSV